MVLAKLARASDAPYRQQQAHRQGDGKGGEDRGKAAVCQAGHG
nr:hypothetical protein [Pseudomonas hygromyciniae]